MSFFFFLKWERAIDNIFNIGCYGWSRYPTINSIRIWILNADYHHQAFDNVWMMWWKFESFFFRQTFEDVSHVNNGILMAIPLKIPRHWHGLQFNKLMLRGKNEMEIFRKFPFPWVKCLTDLNSVRRECSLFELGPFSTC